jgi:hypothetical protein
MMSEKFEIGTLAFSMSVPAVCPTKDGGQVLSVMVFHRFNGEIFEPLPLGDLTAATGAAEIVPAAAPTAPPEPVAAAPVAKAAPKKKKLLKKPAPAPVPVPEPETAKVAPEVEEEEEEIEEAANHIEPEPFEAGAAFPEWVYSPWSVNKKKKKNGKVIKSAIIEIPETMNLITRSRTILAREALDEKITCWRDFLQLSAKERKAIQSYGAKVETNISEELAEHGIELSKEGNPWDGVIGSEGGDWAMAKEAA